MRSTTKTVYGEQVVFEPGAQLGLLNLARVRVRRANLEGAMLKESSIADAKLRRGNFTNADLRGLTARNADLRRSNFAGADLRGAQFQTANLRFASFGGPDNPANTHETNFFSAHLDYADLRGCDLFYGWVNPNYSVGTANIEGARVGPHVMVAMDPFVWDMSPSGYARRPWHYVERHLRAQGLNLEIARMFFDERPGVTLDEILRLTAALARATNAA